VRGEGQEAGVVDRFVVFVAGHHDLHVVVETCGCHAAEVFEGPHVLADRGLQVGRGRESQVLPPRIAQHVTEQVYFAATFLSEVQRVDGVVHLGLNPGTGLKTLHRRPTKLRSQLFHPLAENRIATPVAPATHFFQQSNYADVGIPRQVLAQGRFVSIDQASTRLTRCRQIGCARHPLLLVLGDYPADGLARQVEISRNPAHRLATVPSAEDFASRLVVHGR